MYGEANIPNSQEIVCYAHRSQEMGHIVVMGAQREAARLVEAEGAGRMWDEPVLWFSWERMGKADKQV